MMAVGRIASRDARCLTTPPRKLIYRPEIWNQPDLQSAKSVITTPEAGESTDDRWRKETPVLVDEIGRVLDPHPEMVLLDYGCGVGRVAKGLIEGYYCRVVGVDMSSDMRRLAVDYVQSDRFEAWSPEDLDARVRDGFRAHAAIACWVIQHCVAPGNDLARIRDALEFDGLFFVLNGTHRSVPSDAGWINDGVSVEALLDEMFLPVSKSKLPVEATNPAIATNSYVKVMRNVAAPRPPAVPAAHTG